MQKAKTLSPGRLRAKRGSIWHDGASWELLILCLPAIAGYILFNYVPMGMAIMIPFRNYKFSLGVMGSDWVGLKNFEWIIRSTSLWQVVRNTMLYSIWFTIIGNVVNVIFALLMFDVKNRAALKVYQTISSFPNFISMVVVGFITYAFLSPTAGVMNQLRAMFGQGAVDVYMTPNAWPAILTIVNIWKGIGMGSMVFFAALIGIDTSLYEAATIDGATHLQQTWYISLPHLVPLVSIFMILAAGHLFSGNFDLFYLIPRNIGVLYPTTDVLPTYVYRALKEGTYATGATVSLVQSITGLILVIATNLFVRKISPDNSLF